MKTDQGGEGGSYASLPWAAMLHSGCLLGARLEVSVGHVENGKAADRIRHVVGIVRVGELVLVSRSQTGRKTSAKNPVFRLAVLYAEEPTLNSNRAPSKQPECNMTAQGRDA